MLENHLSSGFKLPFYTFSAFLVTRGGHSTKDVGSQRKAGRFSSKCLLFFSSGSCFPGLPRERIPPRHTEHQAHKAEPVRIVCLNFIPLQVESERCTQCHTGSFSKAEDRVCRAFCCCSVAVPRTNLRMMEDNLLSSSKFFPHFFLMQ